MSDAQARTRRQERIEELCGATIHALVGDADLHFRGHRLFKGRRPLPLFAPHLHPSPDEADFAAFRGAADGTALRLVHSDATLHRSLCPDDPVERLIFDLLEQFRVESLVPDALRGVATNLRASFDAWSRTYRDAGLADTAHGLLLYTVAQVCRTRVTGQPILEEIEDTLEVTRGALSPLIGHDLVALPRHRRDQATYATHALSVARTIRAMSDWASDRRTAGNDGGDREAVAFSLVMDVDRLSSEAYATAVSGRSRVLEDADDGYRVYTTAYDRELDAARVVRRPLLAELRERLDRRIAAQGVNVPRLARELRALLAVPSSDGWDGGRDEGLVDGRRLAQLVASPTERRLFRRERIEPSADCLVTFLIDCSGSMKEHAETVATIVDVFARALELAGVDSEILGFTTGAWNGGRAQRDWMRAGRPPHPGRLNERLHLVFKDAETSWRRARTPIAALLKGDQFREGIDGEAVDWACARMRGRDVSRRLLLVVSDGSPMDGATNLANDTHYLDHHLREVVERQDRAGDIELFGVGVGLDLSPYYARSHVLDLAAAIGNQAFREILELIGRRHRR